MAPPAFDYSNRSAIIQDSAIYYSPNCTQPVVIPSRPVYSGPDPFRQPHLNASMLRQPVWWSYGWGWQSFIPLAPSFVFTSFASLCAMPHIEEVAFSFDGPSREIERETRYRINKYNIQCWVADEEHIVKVASIIQLRYGIPGNLQLIPSPGLVQSLAEQAQFLWVLAWWPSHLCCLQIWSGNRMSGYEYKISGTYINCSAIW